MTIGIDQLGLYTPPFFIDLRELATARGVEPDKYTIGIGQDQQAVAPSSQDVVTMGAAAAKEALAGQDLSKLGLLILATESGVDASKAGALYIHRLLGLPASMRVFELKEACYGGTAGLMMARDYVAAHPGKTALVIASDIARYGLATGGEVTQGAGAVAMVVASAPRILAINDDSTLHADDIQDFWRPMYTDQALARGKYSTEQYIAFFDEVWAAYRQETGRTLADHAAMLFHLPYTKMGLKALKTVLAEATPADQARLLAQYQTSIQYSRRIGNIYTGSLYLGLVSLLENSETLAAGDRLGLFSYGSGAVGEFFSATLQPQFRQAVPRHGHASLLAQRKQLDIATYEQLFADTWPSDSSDYQSDPAWFAGPFVMSGVIGQERQYRAND